ncbi:hypothetical protein ASL20_22775 [Cupriavidus necator]|nr:hypothetical protein ASL20_22775 [Cupriavidus necator]
MGQAGVAVLDRDSRGATLPSKVTISLALADKVEKRINPMAEVDGGAVHTVSVSCLVFRIAAT